MFLVFFHIMSTNPLMLSFCWAGFSGNLTQEFYENCAQFYGGICWRSLWKSHQRFLFFQSCHEICQNVSRICFFDFVFPGVYFYKNITQNHEKALPWIWCKQRLKFSGKHDKDCLKICKRFSTKPVQHSMSFKSRPKLCDNTCQSYVTNLLIFWEAQNLRISLP